MRFRKLFDRAGRGRDGETTGPGGRPEGTAEPFPGYDRVDEMRLIQELHVHSQAELEAIEDYERSHESRTRVLNKLHYLRQREPLPGYDDLGVAEIATALAAADLETIKHVRAYERKFHNRPNVQEAVESARRRREGAEPAHGTADYHATSYGPSITEIASRAPGPGQLAANKTLVIRFYAEVMSGHDLDALDRLLTDDFVHNGDARGRDGQRRAVAEFHAAFPDLQVDTELILAEGDLVSTHQRWTGTHAGEAAGIAPTGSRVEFTSTAVLRVRDGLIAEAWDELDLAGLLAQLTEG